MKVRRILLDEHKERLRRSICPRCKKFALKNIEIVEGQTIPVTKYKLSKNYWVCGSPSGFLCYFMSGLAGSAIFESSEGVSIIDFSEEEDEKPKFGKIIRRRMGNSVEITSYR